MFYPLALKPCIKDYLWGGTRLKTDFGFACDSEKAAEAWMLACHKDGASTVVNGEHAGKTLEQVLALWGESTPAEKMHRPRFRSRTRKLYAKSPSTMDGIPEIHWITRRMAW